MALVGELKRRKVFQIGAAYLVVAWLAVQAASIAFPAFDAPPWALRIFIFAALLGFPVSVALAWVFEATPEGVRLDTSTAGSKRVLAAATALALLALGWFFLGQPSFRRGDVPAPAPKPADAAAPAAKSLAVLPFVDMSAQHDQEYFSDGIAEELLNRLAQSADLRVAARTSAFQFKGRNIDIADIARQLHVAHVLEGSVRKDAMRIRVTAQLIDAASGFHLWSQTFERDAADVFKVQDEIAGAISSALEAKLSGRSAAPAGDVHVDPAAYDDYLQGRKLAALRVGENLRLAADAYTRAIARAPDYAPAYSGRAFAVIIGLGWKPWMAPEQTLAAAEADVAQALRRDPDLAEAYVVRGIALGLRLRSGAAQVEFEHALKLAPGNVDVMNFAGDYFEQVGALRRAETLKRQAMALDPLSFLHPMNLTLILDDQGRYAEAAAMGERAISLARNSFVFEQAYYAKLHLGDLSAARAALEQACAEFGADSPSCHLDQALLLAVTGDKDAARALAVKAAERPTPEWGGVAPHAMAAAVFAYGLGDYALAADHVKRSLDAILWSPALALLWSRGGAKLPEELSQDAQWLGAWNDPRLSEFMTLYRANIAAFRKGE